MIITVIMRAGRWMFPYRIIIFGEGALGFIGLSTEKMELIKQTLPLAKHISILYRRRE